jgi:hypothetical protein
LARSWISLALAAASFGGGFFLAADAWFQPTWEGTDLASYLLLGGWVTGSLGLAAGLILTVGLFLDRSVSRAVGPSAKQFAARTAVWSLIALGLAWSTAFELFSGKGIQRTIWGTVGPYLLLGLLLVCVPPGILLVQAAIRSATAEEGRNWRALSAVALAAALVGVWADLHLQVSLYRAFHEATQFLIWLAVTLAVGLVLVRRRESSWVQRGSHGLAGTGAVALAVLLALPGARADLEQRCAPLWAQPVYVVRFVQQLQRFGASSGEASPSEQLLEKLGIAPEWGPVRVAPPRRPSARAGLADDLNVLVFYVDSLRADVASDPKLMPNLVSLARSSLNFSRAYAPGAETVTSLQSLLFGRFDPGQRCDHGHFHRPPRGGESLLELARQRGLSTRLWIGETFARVVPRQLPAFAFEHVVGLADQRSAAEAARSFGSGPKKACAGSVTDALIRYLEGAGSERFLAWAFYTDVHQWFALKEPDPRTLADRHGVPKELPVTQRAYRGVVAEVDAQLGRVLDVLERTGLAERTIVVVLSDHGEALGFRGYWLHGVFLWESLLRVPLVMRVPGVRPKRIDAPVSLADVAPTLSRFLGPGVELAGSHGEDLLEQLEPEPAARRYPLTFVASEDSRGFMRVGLIRGAQKLVLTFDSPVPELYDLTASSPDAKSQVTGEVRELLQALVNSPVYPAVTQPWEPCPYEAR